MDDSGEITVEILIGSTDKATRMENVIMGLFGNKGNAEKPKKLGFGEVPPRPKLGFSPKKDKALVKRDQEGWRKKRRSI